MPASTKHFFTRFFRFFQKKPKSVPHVTEGSLITYAYSNSVVTPSHSVSVNLYIYKNGTYYIVKICSTPPDKCNATRIVLSPGNAKKFLLQH